MRIEVRRDDRGAQPAKLPPNGPVLGGPSVSNLFRPSRPPSPPPPEDSDPESKPPPPTPPVQRRQAPIPASRAFDAHHRQQQQKAAATPAPKPAAVGTAGRNDPCPCGSGEKFKKCHGKNL
jgi:preprotein translocase subunit SecA